MSFSSITTTSLLTAALLALTPAAEARSYLCVAEKASGFYFNEKLKDWLSTSFQTQDKYLVQPSDSKDFFYEIKRLGEKMTVAYCGNFTPGDNLFCDGANVNSVIFNRRTNRFQLYFIGNYVGSPKDKAGETPFIEIGTCTSLSRNLGE